jgi:hypothetical protein
MAKDEGGPTRDFLSRVWAQIGDLNVRNPLDTAKRAKLFDREAHAEYIIPSTNDKIAKQLGLNVSPDGSKKDGEFAAALIKPFGRAIGRIMLYCIANQIVDDDDENETNSTQRFYIASHIMHNIFRNYLLRGIDPMQDYEYPLLDLLADVVDLKFTQRTKQETTNEMEQMELYVTALDEKDGKDLESNFRQAANQDFITGRSWILESIKEGLTLNGTFRFICIEGHAMAVLTRYTKSVSNDVFLQHFYFMVQVKSTCVLALVKRI